MTTMTAAEQPKGACPRRTQQLDEEEEEEEERGERRESGKIGVELVGGQTCKRTFYGTSIFA